MPEHERIGRYELLHRISAGGMGEIFFARLIGVQEFQKPLVVKRMLPDLVNRPDVVAMFLDEARLVSKLDHPGIVQVFELGEERGQYYLAMELVDGPDLAHLAAHAIDEGKPMAVPVAAWIIARAAEALHFAHEQRDPATDAPLELVHRDISPQNILISKHGEVKIADFGIAKATQRATETQPGSTKGKLAYMAPEQCLGDAVDRRTDVFALGIVLHELLSRRALYGSSAGIAAMQRILLEPPPPPSSANPRVDDELDAIVLTALEKSAAQRYPNALALSRALDAWLIARHAEDPRASLAAWVKAHAGELGPLAGLDRARLLETSNATLVSPPDPPAIAATFVPPRTLLHNLRAESSSFVGRAETLAAVERDFEEGARLLTITGPGGTGKTRFCRELGRRLIAAGKGEAWFVDLTRAESLEGFLTAVASALSIVLGSERSTDQVTTEISHWLARRGSLFLILDNLEQLVEVAAEPIRRWLEEVPALRVVATSREVLRVEGERVLPLAPLSLPGPESDQSSEAVLLFIERAKAVRPTLRLEPSDRATIAEIVRILEGIPLAIELAAARMAVLGPAQLYERLRKSLDVLTSGRRDLTPRQATMRGAIDWSWRLLKPMEQVALAQASVFRGGFLLAEAEAVLLLPDDGGGAPLVVDVLQALADKSLLRCEPGADGEMRYGLYETVREFAAEKLSEAGPVEARHAAAYLSLGEALIERIDRRGGAVHFDHLIAEQHNLTAIVRRVGLPFEDRARAVLVLEAIARRRGPLARSLELLGACVGSPGFEALVRERPALAMQVLWAHANALVVAVDVGAARAQLERSLAIARASHDIKGEAKAKAELGTVLRAEGQIVAAKQTFVEATELLGSGTDEHTKGILCLRLANIDADLGALESAGQFYEHALAIFRRLGDLRYEAITLSNMGFLDAELGQFERGVERSRQSCAMHREIGERAFECASTMVGGIIRWLSGDLVAAREELKRALVGMQKLGGRRYEAILQGLLGAVAAATGEIEDAEERLAFSERTTKELGDRVSLALVQVNSSYLDLARAQRHRARGELEEARAVEAALDQRLAMFREALRSRAITAQGARLAFRALEARVAATRRT